MYGTKLSLNKIWLLILSNTIKFSASILLHIFYIYRSQERGRRKGYMGHLTKMANDIVAVMEKGENSELVKDQFAGNQCCVRSHCG